MVRNLPRLVIDNDTNLLEELENQEEDELVLEELAETRKRKHKSFLSVINKKKLAKHELEEVML